VVGTVRFRGYSTSRRYSLQFDNQHFARRYSYSMTRCQVRIDGTKAGVIVFEANPDSAFVARHAV